MRTNRELRDVIKIHVKFYMAKNPFLFHTLTILKMRKFADDLRHPRKSYDYKELDYEAFQSAFIKRTVKLSDDHGLVMARERYGHNYEINTCK